MIDHQWKFNLILNNKTRLAASLLKTVSFCYLTNKRG